MQGWVGVGNSQNLSRKQITVLSTKWLRILTTSNLRIVHTLRLYISHPIPPKRQRLLRSWPLLVSQIKCTATGIALFVPSYLQNLHESRLISCSTNNKKKTIYTEELYRQVRYQSIKQTTAVQSANRRHYADDVLRFTNGCQAYICQYLSFSFALV